MDRPTGTERRTIRYSGRVQGVGFRWTAVQVAQDHPVVGYVRNLADGDVELVVEGEPGSLEQFLAAVADALSGYIRSSRSEVSPGTGEFDSFSIRV